MKTQQWNKIEKIIQDIKVEIKSTKNETEGKQESKVLGIWTGTLEGSLTNRTQVIDERISSTEDNIE